MSFAHEEQVTKCGEWQEQRWNTESQWILDIQFTVNARLPQTYLICNKDVLNQYEFQIKMSLRCKQWPEGPERFGTFWIRFGTFQDNLMYSVSYHGWTTQNLSNMYLGCPQSIWVQGWGVRNGRKGQYVLVRFGTFWYVSSNLIYSVIYHHWTTQNLSNMYLGCPQSIWVRVRGVRKGRKGQYVLVRFGTFQVT